MRVAILGKLEPVDGVAVYTRQLQTRLDAGANADAGAGRSADGRAEGRSDRRSDRRAGSSAEGNATIIHFAPKGAPPEPGTRGLPYLVRSAGYTVPAPGASRALEEALEEFRPDLIHAQLTTSPLDLLLPRLARRMAIPLVGTFHHGWDYRPTRFGTFSRAVSRTYAPALARYDRVIVFGGRLRRHFASLGVPEERIAIVPNGVDAEFFSPGPEPRPTGAGLRVTYMGRMTPDKNVTALVESFAASGHAGLVLRLAGSGPLYDGLKARFASDSRIRWLGFVSGPEARRDTWRGSDVVVLPSPIEGLSLSLLEGMATGNLPVATDVGEHHDVLEGVGRVLDPLRIERDLRRAWDWLADNAESVQEAGLRARERVLEKYRAEQHWEKLLGLYDELLGGTG